MDYRDYGANVDSSGRGGSFPRLVKNYAGNWTGDELRERNPRTEITNREGVRRKLRFALLPAADGDFQRMGLEFFVQWYGIIFKEKSHERGVSLLRAFLSLETVNFWVLGKIWIIWNFSKRISGLNNIVRLGCNFQRNISQRVCFLKLILLFLVEIAYSCKYRFRIFVIERYSIIVILHWDRGLLNVIFKSRYRKKCLLISLWVRMIGRLWVWNLLKIWT